MSLFMTLTKEHALFHMLIERLERCLKYDEVSAKRELEQGLLVLLPALERHEVLEDLVFGSPVYQSRRGADKLLAAVEAQHRELTALRLDIDEFLKSEASYDLARLKPLVFAFCERLRLHFHIEETKLWPHYRKVMGPLGQAVNLRARAQLKILESEIRQARSMAAEYVGGPA